MTGEPQVVDAPPREATLAEQIAAEVRGAGIERAFGIPGGEVLALIEALERAGAEFVLCNHESSAGMMAAAYGRLSGTPGLVLTTLGPGAANLLLPLANAQLDREALVAICGDLSPELPASHTHQRMDLLGVFGPTT
jgi:acetolactate synthase-1/2/3 large subunit